jgi:hypothetical protein
LIDFLYFSCNGDGAVARPVTTLTGDSAGGYVPSVAVFDDDFSILGDGATPQHGQYRPPF